MRALTPRQRDILQLWAEGLTNPEIAGALGITSDTVRTHAQHILLRLGVHRASHAVAVALRHGLIQ